VTERSPAIDPVRIIRAARGLLTDQRAALAGLERFRMIVVVPGADSDPVCLGIGILRPR